MLVSLDKRNGVDNPREISVIMIQQLNTDTETVLTVKLEKHITFTG